MDFTMRYAGRCEGLSAEIELVPPIDEFVPMI